jgi:hypothetical protein
MATTLNTYVTQCQRLLHDPNGSMWPVSELTDYINEARNRICEDTKCLRALQTGINLTAGQELYTVTTILPAVAGQVVDILGISLYWGNTRFKMNYASFTEFDAMLRSWQVYQSRPVYFTRMGALQVYVGPVPDQNYVTDWDVAITPTPLVNTSDVEIIPAPFQTPVQYYACYKAKFKEQSLGEAKIFKDEYNYSGLRAQRAFMTRVITNPYAA